MSLWSQYFLHLLLICESNFHLSIYNTLIVLEELRSDFSTGYSGYYRNHFLPVFTVDTSSKRLRNQVSFVIQEFLHLLLKLWGHFLTIDTSKLTHKAEKLCAFCEFQILYIYCWNRSQFTRAPWVKFSQSNSTWVGLSKIVGCNGQS